MSMAISGMGGSASTPQVWSGASMRTTSSQKMSNLFDQIDTSGSGTITKAQFEQAFQTMNPPQAAQQAGADAIWAKLDPNGTGSVSKQDFVSGMSSAMSQLRQQHHHHGGAHAAAAQSSSATQTLSSSVDALAAVGSTATGSTIDTTA